MKEGALMTYNHIVEGIFLERMNRFIARVLVNGEEVLAHVKNTGRCKELFIKGTRIYLESHEDPKRKTKYSLINIYKGDLLINMDSQVPNAVAYEAILAGQIPQLKDIQHLKREVTYEDSRFDLYYETKTAKGYIEVKGVTLESDGIACFPDAPTERGKKHLQTLLSASSLGYQNYVFFLIQMSPVQLFRPNALTDPGFASMLKAAEAGGVVILCYDSLVTKDSIVANKAVPYEC